MRAAPPGQRRPISSRTIDRRSIELASDALDGLRPTDATDHPALHPLRQPFGIALVLFGIPPPVVCSAIHFRRLIITSS